MYMYTNILKTSLTLPYMYMYTIHTQNNYSIYSTTEGSTLSYSFMCRLRL